VGSGGHAGDDAHQHVLANAGRAGHSAHTPNLRHIVDADQPDARAHCQLDLGVGLVVAVHRDPARVGAGTQARRQLTTGGDQQAEALLGCGLDEASGGECLHRIHGPREGGSELATPASEVVLVDDEQRRSVDGREIFGG
jgi:hypothetical protein